MLNIQSTCHISLKRERERERERERVRERERERGREREKGERKPNNLKFLCLYSVIISLGMS